MNNMRSRGARKNGGRKECRFRGKKRNEKCTGLNREKIGKRKTFLLAFPSIITRTHFPEGHCTC